MSLTPSYAGLEEAGEAGDAGGGVGALHRHAGRQEGQGGGHHRRQGQGDAGAQAGCQDSEVRHYSVFQLSLN